MTNLSASLIERREQFDTHYALAQALQDRIFNGEELLIGETTLSSRHLLTMKSGLIVHLYNIVEATMSRVMEMIGHAFGTTPPRKWSENALREWLREYGVARVDGAEDSRLRTLHSMSLCLLGENALGPQSLRKPPGTWTDWHIATFAGRLGIKLNLPKEVWLRIAPRPEYRDESPLKFVADRRNAIAHGQRSFEEGANDLTLDQIRELANVALDYLEVATSAFQNYVDHNQYMAVAP